MKRPFSAKKRAGRICGVPWPLFLGGVVITALLVLAWTTHYRVHTQRAERASGMSRKDRKNLIAAMGNCTEAERARQVKGFKDIGHDVWYWGCPKEIWWQLVHEFSPDPAGKVFLDVGMNKGYMAGTWYGLWHPEIGLNVESLHHAIQKIPPNDKQDCGACADCYDHVDPLVPAVKGPLIRVHGVDAAEVAIIKNRAIVKTQFPEVQGRWTSVHAAAGDTIGTVQFAKADTLSEISAIDANTEMVDVDLINVPRMLEDLGNLDEIFVLKIDTEGNDPKVMLGAQKLIADNLVSVVYFEYHKKAYWAKDYDLKWFSESFFADKGFACYFLGHVCAMRLTGCWDDVFEYRDWSNVMCVSMEKAAPLVDKMNEHSYYKNTECKRGLDS